MITGVTEPDWFNNPWDYNYCDTCLGLLVCLCGAEQPSYGWPCSHGGCDFRCPTCENKKILGSV